MSELNEPGSVVANNVQLSSQEQQSNTAPSKHCAFEVTLKSTRMNVKAVVNLIKDRVVFFIIKLFLLL